MGIKYFINGKRIKEPISIDNPNLYIIVNDVAIRHINYYGIYIDRPLKSILGYSRNDKFTMSGFTKKANKIYNDCLVYVSNSNSKKYIKVKKVFDFDYIRLFKYKKEWYMARKESGFIAIECLSENYIHKTFRKDKVVKSDDTIFYLHDKENSMYVNKNYSIVPSAKNVRLYPTLRNNGKFNPLNFLDARACYELKDYYVDMGGLGYYHKSLDGVTPFSFIKLFTKNEIRNITLGTHQEKYDERFKLKSKNNTLPQTIYYRQGKFNGTAVFDKEAKKYSLTDSGGYTCMDFVKTDSSVDYFISQFFTEIYDYTEQDVITWYKHVLKLFDGLYTEKDIKLNLVEVSKDCTVFLRHDGFNLKYWHIELSKNVSAYHKYLFAILFRYCYSECQYSFPVKIMDLIDNEKLDMWTAIKKVLNSGVKETNWDISENTNTIPMELTLDVYLERVKNYAKENKFTELSRN
jgi:hypothetical protein